MSEMKKDFFTEEIRIDPGSKKDMKGMMNKFKNYMALVVIVVVVVISIVGGLYKVDSGYEAVVLRFGKVLKVENKEGLSFKIPMIDTVKMVNVKQPYKMEYGYETLQQGTEKTDPVYRDNPEESTIIVGAQGNNSSIVLMNLMVRYRVEDPVNYLFKVEDLEGTMRLALEDVLRNTVQSHTLEEALTNKELIDVVVLPELQRKMNSYESGVKIIEVKTQNAELLPAVDEAYKQVEKANQYKNGKLEEAQKYRNTVIPQAEAEAIKLIEGAKGYKAEVVSRGKAGVAEFEALYTEYQKNPEIVKEKYYVESMKEFIKNNNIILDTTKSGQIHKFFNMDDGQKPIKLDAVQ